MIGVWKKPHGETLDRVCTVHLKYNQDEQMKQTEVDWPDNQNVG